MKQKKVNQLLVLPWLYSLVVVAGAINVYAIKVLLTPLAHHTGNVSNAAIAFFEDPHKSLYLVLVCVSFFIGASVSGFIYHKRQVVFDKSYPTFLMIGILLFLAMHFLPIHQHEHYLLPFWMGMQNGMFLTFRGVRVRMTHMSGTLTDAGFALGAFLHGNKEDGIRFSYLSSNVVAFFLGGIIAYWKIISLPQPTLVFVGIYILSILYYFFLYRRYKGENFG